MRKNSITSRCTILDKTWEIIFKIWNNITYIINEFKFNYK